MSPMEHILAAIEGFKRESAEHLAKGDPEASKAALEDAAALDKVAWAITNGDNRGEFSDDELEEVRTAK